MNKTVSLGLCAIAGITLVSSCMLPSGSPDHLKKPGVNVQKLPLSKSTFMENSEIGGVTDISMPQDADNIAIAGTLGAAYLGRNGSVKAHVTYDKRADSVTLIPTGSKSAPFKYLCTGSWAVQPRLYNSDGKTEWIVPVEQGANGTAYGIIDQKPGYAVGYNGSGGVRLLDARGKELWTRGDGNVWHIAITSPTKSAPARIVHSNASGMIVARDNAGVVVSKAKAPFYVSQFSLCRWPNASDDQQILSCEKGKIFLFNLMGDIGFSFPVPVEQMFGNCHGVAVHLSNSKSTYLATITSWKQFKSSMFCVHDEKGILQYEEVIPETCASIAVLPQGNSQPDALLVGGTGKVWKYCLAKSKSK